MSFVEFLLFCLLVCFLLVFFLNVYFCFVGCQKVKSWWTRLVGYSRDNLEACCLTLGSWGLSVFQYCPMLLAWAVKFGENHGQILKLDLVCPAFLFVPRSAVPHQLEHRGTSLPPESCQGFPQSIPLPLVSEMHLCPRFGGPGWN